MSARLVTVVTLCLACLASFGCSSQPAKDPSTQAAPATLYNEPAPDPAAKDKAKQDEATLRAAQIRFTAAVAQALRLGAAIWQAQHEGCPTAGQIVEAKLVSTELRTADAWDRPYRVTCGPKGPQVTSSGPDQLFDTADDIVAGEK